MRRLYPRKRTDAEIIGYARAKATIQAKQKIHCTPEAHTAYLAAHHLYCNYCKRHLPTILGITP